MFGMGIWELLVLLLIVLFFFGAKRLPEIGRSLGEGIREFKDSVQEIEDDADAGEGRDREELPGEKR